MQWLRRERRAKSYRTKPAFQRLRTPLFLCSALLCFWCDVKNGLKNQKMSRECWLTPSAVGIQKRFQIGLTLLVERFGGFNILFYFCYYQTQLFVHRFGYQIFLGHAFRYQINHIQIRIKYWNINVF